MPANIFYDEADGTKQGPFAEKQVLEGYRKAWFDASTVFYFTTTEENIVEETERHTLRALIDSNGPENPFAFTDHEAKIAARLDVIEQTITSLEERMSIHMKKLTEKLDSLERTVKETIDQSAATEVDGAGKVDEGPEKVAVDASNISEKEIETNRKQAFTDSAQFVVDFYDALRSINYSSVISHCGLSVDLIRSSESNKREFFSIISQLLKKKEMFVCSVCNLIMINYKHALIHLIDPEHYKNLIETHTIEAVLRLSHSIAITIESETRRLPEYIEWTEKGCELSAAVRRYCTNFGFKRNCTNDNHWSQWLALGQVIREQFESGVFGKNFRAEAMRDHASLSAVFERGLNKLKRGETANQIMSVIRSATNHAPWNENTVCNFCNMLTGSVPEFYEHQCSYAHVSAAPCFDLVTLVTNVIEVRDRVL